MDDPSVEKPMMWDDSMEHTEGHSPRPSDAGERPDRDAAELARRTPNDGQRPIAIVRDDRALQARGTGDARMNELRHRIDSGHYRGRDVVEALARRILASGDLDAEG
jgi:hypothetical protein